MPANQWVELEPGVWGISTPGGLDFLIEDISGASGEASLFQASQLLRTCCTAYEHHLKRFKTRQEAMDFVESMAAEQGDIGPSGN